MKTYTYEEVLKNTVEYFAGDELAANVWISKYALKNDKGEFLELDPEMMHERLASEFARIEDMFGGSRKLSKREILEYFDHFNYIVPQGSPMYGIGNKYSKVSLSNCVAVASPEDTMSSIIERGKEIANLSKHRCGVGIDISTLRPEGAKVNNAAGTSSGAWSFADLYSSIIKMIGQCVAEDQLVLTKRGLVKIKDIIPKKDYVWTKSGWILVSSLLNNGEKEVYKITTNSGFEIETSSDHIFISENNGNLFEKRLKEFSIGDSIILIPGSVNDHEYVKLGKVEYKVRGNNKSNRLNNYLFPDFLNEDFAYFLGYSYGDGNIELDRFGEPYVLTLACSNDWPLIKERLQQCSQNCFSAKLKVNKADGDLERLRLNSKLVLNLLSFNKLLKGYSKDLAIPSQIFCSPDSVKISFLSGLFDSDRYNGGKKSGYYFNTISKKLAQQIQLLLMSMGIYSKIHVERRSDKGWNDLFKVAISGTIAQKRLVENFRDSIKISKKSFVSKIDYTQTPYKARSLGIKHNKFPYISGESYLSCNAFEKIKQEYKNDYGNLLIKSSIKSIEKVGIKNTYDLVLPKEHLYFCQGFQIHNSGRRGAGMISMDVRHPDIEKFVTMKSDLTKVTGANVSVKLRDDFMRAVQKDEEFVLRFPCEGPEIKFSRIVKARDIWNLIVESATKTAEPGILMWDNILNYLPAQSYKEFSTITVNPCSEISLSAFDSCRLISINLKNFVVNKFSKNAYFDFAKMKKVVSAAMRLSDDLVELEIEKLDSIINSCDEKSEKELWSKLKNSGFRGRRTGLGTHGFADVLACMCIKYDSDEAFGLTEKIYDTLRNEAYRESIELAKERGPFEVFNWETEKDNLFINNLPDNIKENLEKYGRRNISILTNAPTGSVSIVSQTSSGIEPVYKNTHIRRKRINHNDEVSKVDFVDDTGDKWQEFKVYHKNVKDYLELNKDSEIPDFFVESDSVDWKKRIKIQSIMQSKIDHSISSTINLPENTSYEIVANIYMEAWKAGLKGVTVYVDGSRSGVLVSNKKESSFEYRDAAIRPEVVECDINNVVVKGEKWTILVGLYDGKPYEVFGGLSKMIEIPKKFKTGQLIKVHKSKHKRRYDLKFGEDGLIKDVTSVFDNPDYQVLTRMVSLALRHGAKPSFLVEQLQKDPDNNLTSFSRVLSRVLKKYIADGTSVTSDRVCTSCESESLIYQDGCVLCTACGWSKCM